MPHIILLGTLDTKLKEIFFLREQILSQSFRLRQQTQVTLIDCGREDVSNEHDTITPSELLAHYRPTNSEDLKSLPRAEAIHLMATCATACVAAMIKGGGVHGIVSAGGSGGSSLAGAVMREAAPIGMPKLIVSTVASGDTGPLIGESDIAMMYSVVDIAGTNTLLQNIFSNAAGSILGMASAYESMLADRKGASRQRKTRIGITMFGVTTPCADKARQHLESNYPVETYVFHATGHGGRAMERLIEEGQLDAVLDLTTTEICDHLMGGNMSAGPHRLEAALRKGLPNIISLGATDMVNFGPKGTVPQKYQDRLLFEHNSAVTLMRTTKEECEKIGLFIADKIKQFAKEPEKVQVWLPRGGVSMIATAGGPFANEEADLATAQAIKDSLQHTAVSVVEDSRAINTEGFAVDMAERLMKLIKKA